MSGAGFIPHWVQNTIARKKRYCRHRDCVKVGVFGDARHSSRHHLAKRCNRYRRWPWKTVSQSWRKIQSTGHRWRGWKKFTDEEEELTEADNERQQTRVNEMKQRLRSGRVFKFDVTSGDDVNKRNSPISWASRTFTKFRDQRRRSRKDSLLPDSPQLKRTRTGSLASSVSGVSMTKLKGLVVDRCRQAVGYVRRFGDLLMRPRYNRLIVVQN